MTRLILVLAFVVHASLSPDPIFAQGKLGNRGGTVRGKITDTTDTHNPIEGVRVMILAKNKTGFTTTTDANGDYKLTGIPAGRYLISLQKEGYNDWRGRSLTVLNDGDHFIPLKMFKKSDVATLADTFFFKKVRFYYFYSKFWFLFFGGIIALFIFLFTKRWIAKKCKTHQ